MVILVNDGLNYANKSFKSKFKIIHSSYVLMIASTHLTYHFLCYVLAEYAIIIHIYVSVTTMIHSVDAKDSPRLLYKFSNGSCNSSNDCTNDHEFEADQQRVSQVMSPELNAKSSKKILQAFKKSELSRNRRVPEDPGMHVHTYIC